MSAVAATITAAMYEQDGSGCAGERCFVTVDPSDEMGAVAQAFNDLVAALERFRLVQEAVAGMWAAWAGT
jgi:HAMP domain-containing protein